MNRINRSLALGTLLALAACTTEPTSGGLPADVVTIGSFEAELSSVTAGSDQAGELLVGATTLRWETEGADSLVLLANGRAVDLGDCAPAGDATECTRRGSLDVTLETSTAYTLLAGPAGVVCSGSSPDARCAEARLLVEARPPVTASLEARVTTAPAGADVSVTYSVEGAESWSIGTLGVEDGRLTLRPCAVGGGGGAALCRMPASAEDASLPASSGSLSLPALRRSLTLAAVGDNGAEDGRGALRLGAVELQVTVAGAPELTAFEIDDDTVGAGDEVTFTWTTRNASAIDFGTDDASYFEAGALQTCSRVDPRDGTGSCTVALRDDAAPGTVAVSAAAVRLGGEESSPRAIVFEVGEPPSVSLVASPAVVPAGGATATLEWIAPRAEGVFLEQLSPEVLTLVDSENPDEDVVCEGGVDADACEPGADTAALEVEGTTTWRVVVSNEFGEASATAAVESAEGPRFTALTLDGAEVSGLVLVEGDSAELAWSVVSTERVVVERADPVDDECDVADVLWSTVSNLIATSDHVTLDHLEKATCFRARAVGAAGQEDERRFSTVPPPSIVAVGVSDTTVRQGTAVELTWEIENAAAVELAVTPSGAISSGQIEACEGATRGGLGSCQVSILAGDVADEVLVGLTFVAVGPTGARSEEHGESIRVGHAPGLELDAAPPILASGGEDVALTWITQGADHVVIHADAARVVDTADGTGDAGCVGGLLEVTCEVESDRYLVGYVEQPRTWTMTASNEFGSSFDTASVTTDRAPSFVQVTLGEADAVDGAAVGTEEASATLWWHAENATRVTVERAPWVREGCKSPLLDSWSVAVDAGPTTGSADLDSLDEPTCVRLTASGADPGAAATWIFRAEKRPEVSGFGVEDDTLTPGSSVRFSWLAPDAVRTDLSLLTQSHASWIDADVLGGCTSVDPTADGAGSCSVPLTPSAGIGILTFRLVAYSAAGTASEASEVTVWVGRRPTVSLSVEPEVSRVPGDPVRISWTVDDAWSTALLAVVAGASETLVELPTVAPPVGCDPCTPLQGAWEIGGIVDNTTFRLVAENDYGLGVEEVGLTLDSLPTIVALSLPGASGDVRGRNVVVSSAMVELTVEVSNATSAFLERADPVDERCAGPDVYWPSSSDERIPIGVDGVESVNLTGLVGHDCFRVTAQHGGSSATATFGAVRQPVLRELVATDTSGAEDTSFARGASFVLSWGADFADAISVVADPPAVVEPSDLSKCTRVDPSSGEGSCVLQVRSDAEANVVVLTATAQGPAGATSLERYVNVTVGNRPTIVFFEAEYLDGDEAALLSWETRGGVDFTIAASDLGVELDTDDLDVNADSTTVDLDETAIFTLTVRNDYGVASSEATVFVGSSVDALTVNGEDALDGAAEVETGDVLVSWVVSGEAGSWVGWRTTPLAARCVDMADSSFTEFEGVGPVDSEVIEGVERNLCIRVVAAESAGASNVVDATVTELPVATSIAAAPTALRRSDPDDIEVTAEVVGATSVKVTAEYLRLTGSDRPEVLTTETVCYQSAPLVGDGGVSIEGDFTLSCVHDIVGLRCILGTCEIPDRAEAIRYVLRLSDIEGDQDVVSMLPEDWVDIVP